MHLDVYMENVQHHSGVDAHTSLPYLDVELLVLLVLGAQLVLELRYLMLESECSPTVSIPLHSCTVHTPLRVHDKCTSLQAYA